MGQKKREATKLVRWLRTFDNRAIQTLLYLPSMVRPFYAYLKTNKRRFWRRTVVHRGGLNPGKTFYVIGDSASWATSGLANIEPYVAANCAYAEKRGWIPVVDMKNFPTMYHTPETLGKENVWDWYYEQPGNISLEEALKSRRCVLSNSNPYFHNWLRFPHLGNPANRSRIQRIYRTYIRVKPALLAKMEAECAGADLVRNQKRILGVVCRGTDFVAARPSGHSIPPATAEAIRISREELAAHSCDALYLATEDQDILDAFIEAFGDALIYENARRFRAQPGVWLYQYDVGPELTPYRRGYEYLLTLTMLSKCDCLIGVPCSALWYAHLRRPQREYFRAWPCESYAYALARSSSGA